MLDKRGSLLIDALLALTIASLMIFLLSGALRAKVISERNDDMEGIDVKKIHAEAKRLYLDRDVGDNDDTDTLHDAL